MRLSTCRPARSALLAAGFSVALSMAVSAGSAGEPPEGPRPTSPATPDRKLQLTWDDIVRRAVGDPRRGVGLARASAAEAEVGVARAAPNPTLELGLGRGHARVGDDARTEWGAAVEMPLSWIARRGPRIDATKHAVVAAKHEARTAWLEALFELNDLFWRIAQDQKLILEMEALAAETSAIADAVGRRVEKGEARPIERLKIDVEREAINGETMAARLALESESQQLATWLGLESARVAVTAELDSVPSVPELAAIRARVLANHPAIKAAEARVRAATAELDAEGRNRIPEVSIRGFTQSELDRRAYGASVSLGLPLWNWNSTGVARARAQVALARQESALVVRVLDARLAQKQGQCAAAVSLAKVHRERLLPAAEQSAAVAATSYRLGEIGLLEVIDSRRVLIDARKTTLTALGRAHAECQQLAILAGTEMSP